MRQPGRVTLSDEALLALLADVEIDFTSDIAIARTIYEADLPAGSTEPAFDSLIEEGWIRVLWGRISIVSDLFRVRQSPPLSTWTAFGTLLDRQHDQIYRIGQAARSRADLASTISDIDRGELSPRDVGCQSPEWIAARLWEILLAKHPDSTSALRAWVDRWLLLGFPELVPQRVWAAPAFIAFREASLDVLGSDQCFPGWAETRALFAKRIALLHNQPAASAETLLPLIPSSLVGRALWLDDNRLQHSLMAEMGASEELVGLAQLLLADIRATELCPVPNPLSVDLFGRAIARPELLFNALHTIRAHPVLVADLLVNPATSPLACLLIAQWQPVQSGSWGRELNARDSKTTKSMAFADAVSVLGHFLEQGSVQPEEVAPLLVWVHGNGTSDAEDATQDGNPVLSTLRGELVSHSPEILGRMVLTLTTPAPKAGLGSPSFAAALDVVELGNLTGSIDPAALLEPYATSVALGEYALSAHRVGVGAAASLFELAKRAPDDLRQRFLCPIDTKACIAAGEAAGENPYAVLDALARSLRAHIRVLSRAVAGAVQVVDEELADALVAAVRAGALHHEEKGRVPAFSPTHESGQLRAFRDRPIAADLGAALHAMRDQQRQKLLAAILQTDEPMVLAQLLSYAPDVTKTQIRTRIGEITPAEAGRLLSYPEMQARIDMLLSAGLLDVAEAFMEAELNLKTMGRVPGRELNRIRWTLRLQLARSDWTGIANTAPPASMSSVEQYEALQTIEFYKALAILRRPDGDPKVAEAMFAGLRRQRPDIVSYSVNFFATRISRLVGGNAFGQLQGAELVEGRQMLRDGEDMIARAHGLTPSDNEIYQCNKAMLLLALGEPEQANDILTTIRSSELRDSVAAFAAIARARMGHAHEGIAILDEAKQRIGDTDLLRGARAHIESGSSYFAPAAVSTDTDPKQRVKAALSDLLHMSAHQQAVILHPESETLSDYVTQIVRSSAGRLIGLVPMFRGASVNFQEDDLNAFLRELLNSQVGFLGWSFPDQSKGGYAASGNPGERDLILLKDGNTLAVIEAVINSDGIQRKNLTSHFQKLLGYAPCPLFFHLTYSYAQDPPAVLTHLKHTAEHDAPSGFAYRSHEDLRFDDSMPTGFAARYQAPLGEVTVVYLLLDMGQHAQRDAAKLAAATKGTGKTAS